MLFQRLFANGKSRENIQGKSVWKIFPFYSRENYRENIGETQDPIGFLFFLRENYRENIGETLFLRMLWFPSFQHSLDYRET